MDKCSCPRHAQDGFWGVGGTPADIRCPLCDTPLCLHCLQHCRHDCKPPYVDELRELEWQKFMAPREPVPA